MSDPCLKVSGGVEKHRAGARGKKLRALSGPPTASVRDMRDIQISYAFLYTNFDKLHTVCVKL